MVLFDAESVQKSRQSEVAFGIFFIHRRVVQNFGAHVIYIVGSDLLSLFCRVYHGVLLYKHVYHISVNVKRVALGENRVSVISDFFGEDILNIAHLLFKSAGQNIQAHRLDKTYALFFDIVIFGMSVIYSVGILLTGHVVSQNQIYAISVVVGKPDRWRNRVVSYSVCGFTDYICAFVGITFPFLDYIARKRNNRVSVKSRKMNYGVVPIQQTYFYVGIFFAFEFFNDAGMVHGH